jgi:hypothetical protein
MIKKTRYIATNSIQIPASMSFEMPPEDFFIKDKAYKKKDVKKFWKYARLLYKIAMHDNINPLTGNPIFTDPLVSNRATYLSEYDIDCYQEYSLCIESTFPNFYHPFDFWRVYVVLPMKRGPSDVLRIYLDIRYRNRTNFDFDYKPWDKKKKDLVFMFKNWLSVTMLVPDPRVTDRIRLILNNRESWQIEFQKKIDLYKKLKEKKRCKKMQKIQI